MILAFFFKKSYCALIAANINSYLEPHVSHEFFGVFSISFVVTHDGDVDVDLEKDEMVCRVGMG